MKLHYLQHVPFEGLGSIASWCQEHELEPSSTKLFAEEKLPQIGDFDCLIVLGGSMNIYESRRYPWLSQEKQFIEKAMSAGKAVIGICLGAQLIADVFGARVFSGEQKEIGWFPVSLGEEAYKLSLFSDFPKEFDAFHWHGDTFDIPNGTIAIGQSEACENQGFIYQEKILGLQFHLETTPESVSALLENNSHELSEAPFIQTPKEMLEDETRFEILNQQMNLILDRLTQGAIL